MGILLRPGTPRLLSLLLWAALGAHVALRWSDIPERMASHFGPSGLPNGWMSRESFFTTMAIAGGGTTLLLMLAPLTLRIVPRELINLPNKDYWLAPERRESTMARFDAFMSWFGLTTSAVIALALELSVAANLSQGPLDNAVFVTGLVIYAVVAVGLLVAMLRAFRVPEKG